MSSGKKCWCGGRVDFRNLKDDTDFGCLESEFHQWNATGEKAKITKLYVAGPMTGYPEANYPEFNEVSRRLEDAGYTVVNPATAVAGTEAHYVDFLREDLKMMLECDGVATLDRWWASSGARNEVNVAGLLKMPVRMFDVWLERAFTELG